MAVDLAEAPIIRRDPSSMVTVLGAAAKAEAQAHMEREGPAMRMAVRPAIARIEGIRNCVSAAAAHIGGRGT